GCGPDPRPFTARQAPQSTAHQPAARPPARRPTAKEVAMTTSHVLGQGLLTWPAAERHSDRYGTVCLTRDEAPRSPYEPVHFVDLDHSVDGLRGTLVAEVLQPRTSRHIGDLSRGLMPQPATVGER